MVSWGETEQLLVGRSWEDGATHPQASSLPAQWFSEHRNRNGPAALETSLAVPQMIEQSSDGLAVHAQVESPE